MNDYDCLLPVHSRNWRDELAGERVHSVAVVDEGPLEVDGVLPSAVRLVRVPRHLLYAGDIIVL